MSKAPKLKLQEAPTPASEEVLPEASVQTIDFPEPPGVADQTVIVHSDREVVTDAQMAALRAAAEQDNTKRDFTLAVLEARRPIEPELVPQPIAPRIVDQTNAEMAAGRAAVAKADEHYARHGRPKSQEEVTNTVSVFRPEDYVPDQKKGQGYTDGRSLNK